MLAPAVPYILGSAAGAGVGAVANSLMAPKAPKAPQPVNSNDAANAAQSQQDALRARRGLLSNIYGGNTGQTPVTGKTQLGS
jgi:hypothetical protein